MNPVEKEQFEMVARLAKPGEAILAALTPEMCHIDHMVKAMLGEAVELYLNTDHENLVEELGDYRFYQFGLYAAFNLTTAYVKQHNVLVNGNKPMLYMRDSHPRALLKATNDLFDLSKKWLVHGKPERFLAAAGGTNDNVIELLACIEYRIESICIFNNITLDEVLIHNQNKLEKR